MAVDLRSPAEMRESIPGFMIGPLRRIADESPFTAAHMVRVAEMGRLAGLEIVGGRASAEQLFFNGITHDWGKIKYLDLVNTPRPFTPEDVAILAQHAEDGAEFLYELYQRERAKNGTGNPLLAGSLLVASRFARYHHTRPTDEQLWKWRRDGSADYIGLGAVHDRLDAGNDPDRPYDNPFNNGQGEITVDSRVGLIFRRDVGVYHRHYYEHWGDLHARYNAETVRGMLAGRTSVAFCARVA